MHYVWQHRLFPTNRLATVDGQRVSIIDPGIHNTDSGPDFFNATVEINGQTWVGNIEIHVKASDWYRHGHDKNKAYDSVILHVVDYDDSPVKRTDGTTIPQMRMPCSTGLSTEIHRLTDTSANELPCARQIAQMPQIYITDWLSSLAYERVQDKVERIEHWLNKYTCDWEETCYITLSRSLGFGINSESFERLARSTPMRFMRKHADSILSLEALLFGQAGFLDTIDPADSYAGRLKTEYTFLSKKFGLRKPDSLGWKLSRMRPQTFPYRRIALLAQVIHNGFSLMSQILDVRNADDARRLFNISLSGFWSCHYTFTGARTAYPINLSRSSVDILIINSVVPLLYAYSIATGDTPRSDIAIEILHELHPESNAIVNLFNSAGIKCPDAFTTQALIQLRRQYCEKHKCLYCRIGHRMLSSASVRATTPY